MRLTADKMLDERRHFVLLERLDGVADRLTRKESIRRETFPVAPVVHGAAHRTDDDGEGNLCAEAGVLGAFGVRSAVEEVAVKRRGSRNLSRELSRVSRLDTCGQGREEERCEVFVENSTIERGTYLSDRPRNISPPRCQLLGAGMSTRSNRAEPMRAER